MTQTKTEQNGIGSAPKVHSQGVPWNARQTEFLRRHTIWSDERVAAAVSLLGPARTVSAVKGCRERLKLRKAPSEHTNAEWLLIGTKRSREARKGWPEMKGEHEDRDREFQRRLWKAMLKSVRSQDVANSSA